MPGAPLRVRYHGTMSLEPDGAYAYEVLNPEGKAPVLLVCDHASRAFPEHLGTLGVAEPDTFEHIAWDIGAADVTRGLSRRLDATAVLCRWSRLVVDCNRRLSDPTAFIEISDGIPVPGNDSISVEDRAWRVKEIWEPYHAAIDTILDQTKRITSILRTLSGFARGSQERVRFESVDLRAVAEDAIHLVGLSERGKKVAFSCRCPERLNVVGNPQQLSQVIVNLLTNACDASAPGQEVTVSAEHEGDRVRILVEDRGKGMDDADKALVFEPFFTTKSPGQGTGLGLAVVDLIIEQHQGQIEIDSRPGEGTCVSVVLPAARTVE